MEISAMLTECLDEQGEEGVAHQELVQSRPALSDHGQHQDDAGARSVHDAPADRVWSRIGLQVAPAELLLDRHHYSKERHVMAGKTNRNRADMVCLHALSRQGKENLFSWELSDFCICRSRS